MNTFAFGNIIYFTIICMFVKKANWIVFEFCKRVNDVSANKRINAFNNILKNKKTLQLSYKTTKYKNTFSSHDS